MSCETADDCCGYPTKCLCIDCGLPKESEVKDEPRCEPCRRAWNEKMKELGQ